MGQLDHTANVGVALKKLPVIQRVPFALSLSHLRSSTSLTSPSSFLLVIVGVRGTQFPILGEPTSPTLKPKLSLMAMEPGSILTQHDAP